MPASSPPRSRNIWIRVVAWSCVVLVSLVLLTWVSVDESGANHWRATQAMIAREGLTLDYRAAASDPIPDADNFCAIPLLKDLTLVRDGDLTDSAPRQNLVRLESATGASRDAFLVAPHHYGATLGQRADLEEWMQRLHTKSDSKSHDPEAEASRNALKAISKQDAIFDELAAGLHRTQAQWTPAFRIRELPENLWTAQYPHARAGHWLFRSLSIRSIGAARSSDSAKAHECAQIMARLELACLDEPCFPLLSTSAYGATNLVNATWELCDAQAGTAEDFRCLESSLGALDFRRSTWRAFGIELTSAVQSIHLLKEPHGDALYSMQEWAGFGGGIPKQQLELMINTLPSGFLDANSSLLAQRGFSYFVKPLRDQGWKEALSSARTSDLELQALRGQYLTHPSFVWAQVWLPMLPRFLERAFFAQMLTNQAIIACALERYRIENGGYPDSLENVKLADGRPLPLDLLTGKLPGYRKTANGKYTLWNVSYGGVDHGGVRVLDGTHPELTRFTSKSYLGDWVWDFPDE